MQKVHHPSGAADVWRSVGWSCGPALSWLLLWHSGSEQTQQQPPPCIKLCWHSGSEHTQQQQQLGIVLTALLAFWIWTHTTTTTAAAAAAAATTARRRRRRRSGYHLDCFFGTLDLNTQQLGANSSVRSKSRIPTFLMSILVEHKERNAQL